MELFLPEKLKVRAACALFFVSTGVLCLVPKTAWACSICFYGDSDSPANRGLQTGVLTLLAVLAVIMIVFVTFLMKFKKRSKMFMGHK